MRSISARAISSAFSMPRMRRTRIKSLPLRADFRTLPPDNVACLQGVLDYYNPRSKLVGALFHHRIRHMVPDDPARYGKSWALQFRLAARRSISAACAWSKLGGWDAHNVTEDADLGFRLARHGYRTEMIGTVTGGRGKLSSLAWVKQRSRWLKGYMTTYLVHMRRPIGCYTGNWALGNSGGFRPISSRPCPSSFWRRSCGPSGWSCLACRIRSIRCSCRVMIMVAFGTLFLMIEAINIAIYISSPFQARGTGTSSLGCRRCISMSHLGSIAAYKALYELIAKPFFWDKTTHGLSLNGAHCRRTSDDAVDLTGIKFKTGHEGF